ncbi:MAG: Gfo/Idh/MocA family oxidoreductase [Kiritimatiellales bacterium]|nr:Gfo/Idh/MocA family oxidoreductase [Kiritimatiellales bacterium]
MNTDRIQSPRRDFVKLSSAAIAGAAPLAATIPASIYAAGSDKVRVGVIGCGNRGSGAATNCLEADPSVEIVAVADALSDRVAAFTNKVHALCQKQSINSRQRVRVTPDTTFIGFDGYRKMLAMDDLDLVIITSPVTFHPLHLEATINAGKNAFMEKPAAVDPVGARRVIAAGELARQKGLAVGVGTQRRHQATYLNNHRQVADGAIGRIVSGRIWWLGGDPRVTLERIPGESDAQLMVRNWYQFVAMCGDHIVEQHVHNIDVANWFIGRPPQLALGFGGRARRALGDRYDFFSVDFDYGEGVTVHSMARQVNGCYKRVGEQLFGTEGSVWPGGKITGKGTRAPKNKKETNPYVQEHADLIQSIREGNPLNGARSVAEATLAAIMGRISAYTGQIVRWTDLTQNTKSPWYDLSLSPTPEDFETGSVKLPLDGVIPVPGTAEA